MDIDRLGGGETDALENEIIDALGKEMAEEQKIKKEISNKCDAMILTTCIAEKIKLITCDETLALVAKNYIDRWAPDPIRFIHLKERIESTA